METDWSGALGGTCGDGGVAECEPDMCDGHVSYFCRKPNNNIYSNLLIVDCVNQR